MNTNELNDSSSNNASLDLINIGMGLGGVVANGGDLQLSTPVNSSSAMSNQFSIGNLMKSHTPPPPMPSAASLMSTSQMLNTPNNLQFNSQTAKMSSTTSSSTSKSASKKRKLDDLGIENISDSENSSSGSNSSSNFQIYKSYFFE
jgi:hypothetical protein